MPELRGDEWVLMMVGVTVTTPAEEPAASSPVKMTAAQKREAALALRALLNAYGGPQVLRQLAAWLEAPPAKRKPKTPAPQAELDFASESPPPAPVPEAEPTAVAAPAPEPEPEPAAPPPPPAVESVLPPPPAPVTEPVILL